MYFIRNLLPLAMNFLVFLIVAQDGEGNLCLIKGQLLVPNTQSLKDMEEELGKEGGGRGGFFLAGLSFNIDVKQDLIKNNINIYINTCSLTTNWGTIIAYPTV